MKKILFLALGLSLLGSSYLPFLSAAGTKPKVINLTSKTIKVGLKNGGAWQIRTIEPRKTADNFHRVETSSKVNIWVDIDGERVIPVQGYTVASVWMKFEVKQATGEDGKIQYYID